MRASPGRSAGRRGRSDQFDLTPDLRPSSSIAGAGALPELRVLAREERDDWLEQQRAFDERVIAGDSHEAEPALRLLADEGRELLPPAISRPGLLLTSMIEKTRWHA